MYSFNTPKRYIVIVLLLTIFIFFIGYSQQYSTKKEATKLSLLVKCRTDSIIKALNTLSTTDKINLWNSYHWWYNYYLNNLSLQSNNDTIITYAVNGSLFYKGLLRFHNQEITKFINESQDTSVTNLYNKIKSTKELLCQFNDSITNITDSLLRQITDYEHLLLSKININNKYLSDTAIIWEQIQSHLKKNEAAIDFISFEKYQSDSILYIAYIIHPDYNHPILVPLSEEAELNKIDSWSTDWSKRIWLPLANHLKNINIIYFSPTGILYDTPIEHVPDWDDSTKLISNRWELHRLSSLKEILKRETYKRTYQSAILYGGMNYNMNIAMGPSIKAKTKPLIGTKIQANEIYRILNEANIHTELLMGNSATETSLKALSGKNIDIVFIGTHGGFFQNDEISPHFRNITATISNRNNPMLRSILLFSGVDYIISGFDLPLCYDDGILTAQEVALLDLSKFEFVITTGCESGRGVILNDETFGLQRGFKEAGAKTLMMSLWPVNDHATQLFMTHFFKYIALGVSKTEALKNAQQDVRFYKYKKNGITFCPYEDCEFWSGFILIDAFD